MSEKRQSPGRLRKPRPESPTGSKHSLRGVESQRNSSERMEGGRSKEPGEARPMGHSSQPPGRPIIPKPPLPMTGAISSNNEGHVVAHDRQVFDSPAPPSKTHTSPSRQSPSLDAGPHVPLEDSNLAHSSGEYPPSAPRTRKDDKHSRPEETSEQRGKPKLAQQEEEARKEWQKQQEQQQRQEEDARRRLAIEEKQTELNRLKDEVDKAAQIYKSLGQKNAGLKAEAAKLHAQWSADHEKLESQRQILNASRSFAAREGTLDAATLIQSFKDLNSSIGDFSFEVLRGLDEKADTIILTQKHYNALRDAVSDSGLKHFVEMIEIRKDLKASDVVDPIVTGIIVAELMYVVFQPFVPGLDQEQSAVLHEMYAKMRQSEPQERSARWRSITYNHAVSNPSTFLTEVAQNCIEVVHKVLQALSESEVPPLTEEFKQLVLSIFDAAIKVQKRAKTEYVSFDYDVYSIKSDEKYNSQKMDVSQAGGAAPRRVWVTVGLGMKATKKIANGQELERSVPVKAMVVCDNWDHDA